jgi:methyl-accepting chemotaxis protein
MDQMTQQNAAMVEQTSAASQTLAREGEELARLISRFKVGGAADIGSQRARGRPVRTAAPPSSPPKKVARVSGGGGAAVAVAAPSASPHEEWTDF